MAATRTAARSGAAGKRASARATARVETTPAAIRDRVAARQPLPWLGMVGVPLAVTAALLIDQWLAVVPLALCAWWWAPRSWGWEWVAALQTGVVGAAWAALGAVSLGAWPDNRLAIAGVWIATAAGLAAAALAARRRGGKP